MGIDRRGFLAGSVTGLSMVTSPAVAELAYKDFGKFSQETFEPDKPVTAIVIGAGNRGHVYGNYALSQPKQLNIVGVAEPIPLRRDGFGDAHDIDEKNRFETWEHVFEREKFADAVIISTPDDLHFEPLLRAASMGYHVLLEKPMAQSMEECLEIASAVEGAGIIAGVAHVLRYNPYYREMKAMLDRGMIGELVSIDHLEPINYAHIAHSYVRGIWQNKDLSTPMIIAKSCHDLDILYWMTGARATSVAASGELSWFKPENAPEGATDRCTDGCPHLTTCPYSAVDIYLKRNLFLGHLDVRGSAKGKEAHIMERLQTTQYGRCVYKSDNNQPDHYSLMIEYENGVSAALSIQGLTSTYGRRSALFGSAGDIYGDSRALIATPFGQGEVERYDPGVALGGHGGGDAGIMYDWVRAVHFNEPQFLSSGVIETLESHAIGFAAEKSRVSKTREVVDVAA